MPRGLSLQGWTVLQLQQQGRLAVPKEYQEALGLGPGDTVAMRVEGDRLVVRRVHVGFDPPGGGGHG